jgi:predicted flap endonuclease-1-like 5' DNA nuclease
MLLERVEVDKHGPLKGIGLGPFSHQLNVIQAAQGSGKTAWVRYIRDSLCGAAPACRGLEQSRGEVVWAAADGNYHCRREPDGSPQGNRSFAFHGYPGFTGHAAPQSYLSDQRHTIAQGYPGDDTAAHPHAVRHGVVVDVPPAIADGIVTDTTLTSIRRVIASVIAAGLDSAANATPAWHHPRQSEIIALQGEIARLGLQLRRRREFDDRQRAKPLRDRLAALTLELSALDARRDFGGHSDAALASRADDRQRLTRAVDDVDRLRRKETTLRDQIAACDREWKGLQAGLRRDQILAEVVEIAGSRMRWFQRQARSIETLARQLRELGSAWFGDRFASRPIPAVHHDLINGTDPTIAPPPYAETNSPKRSEVAARLESICRGIDRLIGGLESDQQRWLESADHDFVTTNVVTESEQAILRQHRQAAEDGSVPHPGLNVTAGDAAWVDDPVRRGRIDALRKSERRNRLHEITDGWSPNDDPNAKHGTHGALLLAIRSIGATLHGIAQRLTAIKPHFLPGDLSPGPNAWDPHFSLDEQPLRLDAHDGGLFFPADSPVTSHPASPLLGSVLSTRTRSEVLLKCEAELLQTLRELHHHRAALAARVARAQRLPAELLQAVAAGELTAEALRSNEPADAPRDARPVELLISESASGWATDANAAWTLRDVLPQDDESVRLEGLRKREARCQELQRLGRDHAAELSRVVEQMNRHLTEAEAIRKRLRNADAAPATSDDDARRAKLEAEIRDIQDRLASPELTAIELRYRECWHRLRTLQSMDGAAQPGLSPLAQAAGGYLERLSGGRLRELRWDSADDGYSQRHLAVRVDGHAEESLHNADRFLAALAVRLAAADELARRGRPLPLIIEAPDGLLVDHHAGTDAAPARSRQRLAAELSGPTNLVGLTDIVAVLAEASTRGRQIIVLTDHPSATHTLVGFGAHGFDFSGRRQVSRGAIESANREFDIDWRQTYEIPDTSESRPSDVTFASPYAPPARNEFDQPASGTKGMVTAEGGEAVASANRPQGRRGKGAPSSLADPPKPVVPFPIGRRDGKEGPGGAPLNPFSLTGDSPIEQAPSIDTPAVSKLRDLGVTTIEQLLESSPSQLAQRMSRTGVSPGISTAISPGTIRRWQHECRLLCGVRGLRPFDSRILVGCGITHPSEVARVQPAELAERVEAFVATNDGASILRSGTPREIDRLTRWIRQAKGTEPANIAPKFFLSRRSPVEAAPAIGPKMAQRLSRLGIRTVDELLAAPAAKVAERLKVRDVNETTVRAWQHQAELVCQVPLLRGHDAQLLVAAGIVDAKNLSENEPQAVLDRVKPIADSREGKRMLRGAPEPDLAEVTTWVTQARQSFEYRAAS